MLACAWAEGAGKAATSRTARTDSVKRIIESLHAGGAALFPVSTDGIHCERTHEAKQGISEPGGLAHEGLFVANNGNSIVSTSGIPLDDSFPICRHTAVRLLIARF